MSSSSRPINPDKPPDSGDPSGPCPRCGRTSNFRVAGSYPLTYGGGYSITADGHHEPNVLEQVTALYCYGCQHGVAVVEEQTIGGIPKRLGGRSGTVSWRGFHWWPPAMTAALDDSIPHNIQGAFTEGAKCLSIRASRAAAVMFRRTLEAVVRDKGSSQAVSALSKSLANALKVMADEGTLDASLAEWAKEIRLAGNVGGHFDPVKDVTVEEAESLAQLLQSIFEYLYEAPARIQRARQATKPAT